MFWRDVGGDEESNAETQNGSAVAGSSSSDVINNTIKDLSEGSLASLVSSQPMSLSSELQLDPTCSTCGCPKHCTPNPQ